MGREGCRSFMGMNKKKKWPAVSSHQASRGRDSGSQSIAPNVIWEVLEDCKITRKSREWEQGHHVPRLSSSIFNSFSRQVRLRARQNLRVHTISINQSHSLTSRQPLPLCNRECRETTAVLSLHCGAAVVQMLPQLSPRNVYNICVSYDM